MAEESSIFKKALAATAWPLDWAYSRVSGQQTEAEKRAANLAPQQPADVVIVDPTARQAIKSVVGVTAILDDPQKVTQAAQVAASAVIGNATAREAMSNTVSRASFILKNAEQQKPVQDVASAVIANPAVRDAVKATMTNTSAIIDTVSGNRSQENIANDAVKAAEMKSAQVPLNGGMPLNGPGQTPNMPAPSDLLRVFK